VPRACAHLVEGLLRGAGVVGARVLRAEREKVRRGGGGQRCRARRSMRVELGAARYQIGGVGAAALTNESSVRCWAGEKDERMANMFSCGLPIGQVLWIVVISETPSVLDR
jgi:hypothetical protein